MLASFVLRFRPYMDWLTVLWLAAYCSGVVAQAALRRRNRRLYLRLRPFTAAAFRAAGLGLGCATLLKQRMLEDSLHAAPPDAQDGNALVSVLRIVFTSGSATMVLFAFGWQTWLRWAGAEGRGEGGADLGCRANNSRACRDGGCRQMHCCCVLPCLALRKPCMGPAKSIHLCRTNNHRLSFPLALPRSLSIAAQLVLAGTAAMYTPRLCNALVAAHPSAQRELHGMHQLLSGAALLVPLPVAPLRPPLPPAAVPVAECGALLSYLQLCGCMLPLACQALREARLLVKEQQRRQAAGLPPKQGALAAFQAWLWRTSGEGSSARLALACFVLLTVTWNCVLLFEF